MIRNILVGLDLSAGSRTAVGLGIEWANRYGAELVGLAVLDEPGIRAAEPTGIGGGYYKAAIERARLAAATAEVNELVREFRRRCGAAGVRHDARTVTGDPVRAVLDLHDDFDVTLLGRETRFRFATRDGPDDVPSGVLRQARRPVAVVPDLLPAGGPVVVAYDGSEAAVDALRAFAAARLGVGRLVSVVSVAGRADEAARRAGEAARYLAHHDVPAVPRPVTTTADAGAALDAAAEAAGASMVVMGAFAGGRQWFRRSATTRMLRSPNRLLYLHRHPD